MEAAFHGRVKNKFWPWATDPYICVCCAATRYCVENSGHQNFAQHVWFRTIAVPNELLMQPTALPPWVEALGNTTYAATPPSTIPP